MLSTVVRATQRSGGASLSSEGSGGIMTRDGAVCIKDLMERNRDVRLMCYDGRRFLDDWS